MPASSRRNSILVEHAHERLQGQLEVAVLLHVEVDERERCRTGGASVEPTESVGDPLDRVLECERVEVGDDRRHLHRHVVDIGAVDALLDLPQPLVGFGVGEDRFAERVHVDPHGIGAALVEMAGEPRIFGGEHDAAGLAPDAPHDQRHHQRGQ